MTATPPHRNSSTDSYPWWALIGPALAAVIGMFMLTMLFFGTTPVAPVQISLGLSRQEFLTNGIASYLLAAVLALPLGILLGTRSVSAAVLPGVFLMLLGVLVNAFVSGAFMLLAGRLLSGLGAGAVIGVTVGLVRKIEGRRGIAAVTVAVLGVVALIVAPFVNQAIAGGLGFRWMFLTAVPFLLVALFVNAVSGIARFTMRKRRPAGPPPAPAPAPPPPR